MAEMEFEYGVQFGGTHNTPTKAPHLVKTH